MPMHSFHSRDNESCQLKTTILVVDDEKMIRELCLQGLREYRVFQAGTCAEALRIYEQERVDLVLSDVVMPGESGIDLLKQIKLLDPNATVIIMTGFVDKETILKALKEDADDFINKPLNLLQLKTAVKKTLGRKLLKEELANFKRSEELKNAFLSLVSHKLRTPLTSISLFLQNIRTGVIGPGDPLFEQNVIFAGEEAKYLGRLVEDLLVFSQVMVSGAGINKCLGNLNELVADVLLKCREVHCNFGIDVDVASDETPPVPLDEAKIRFALMQVIDNAFKFSGECGNVTVKISSHGDSVFVVVSDSGVGIPEAELPKVFEKFYQIDPEHTGQIRGFGLGLFYAREFVRQHGGDISLDSEPGLGTTVTIRLPLQ